MKVLFDHQIFSDQIYGGISRYHYELLKNLPKVGIDVDLSVKFSNNYYIRNKDVSRHTHFFPRFNLKLRNDFIRKKNQALSVQSIRVSDFDIFHPTYYNEYFLAALESVHKPFVLTIHDMTLEKLCSKDPSLFIKRRLIQGAVGIIAISENTKKDIIEMELVPPERIQVIYHGADSSFCSYICSPKGMRWDNYLLFVGARHKYKNFDRLLIVFEALTQKDKDLRLICTGSSFTQEEKSRLNYLGISEKVKSISCRDSELAWLYKHARAFVFPSLYEGFGFPILEAFQMSCPTALSTTSCFPEIAGDAAAYFNPNDDDSMYETLLELLSSPLFCQDLVKKGKLRLSCFSWNKTAWQTAELYRSLI